MILGYSFLLFSLFTTAFGENISEDVEVILLPVWNSYSENKVPITFTVFGRKLELTLRKNDKLLAPSFRIWRHGVDKVLKEVPELSTPSPCHYLHQDNLISAAISVCHHRTMHGLIFLENVTLEITPLRRDNSWLSNDHLIKGRSGEILKEPHLVRRATISSRIALHKDIPDRPTILSNFNNDIALDYNLFSRPRRGNGKSLTLELAVFFDEPAYRLFSPFMDKDEEKMRDMLLAYINGVQALYHHPTLGSKIDLALVRLDLMQRQPSELPHHNGERNQLLDSFCDYAKINNPSGDKNPNHWDMGLYVSGLDFYAIEGGKKSGVTMGLATVGGICLDQYACVIAELGTTNVFGKPYPSAGFTSVYIAAHEIGHNLGMHHDSTGNPCPRDGYIMSPSRGTQGETIWSECSRDVARKLIDTKTCLLDEAQSNYDKSLDHAKYLGLPGRDWNAKKQCEVLLRDNDAIVVTLSQACQSLQCKTPHRSGYYFAGPALDGTYCAKGKECRGGECLPKLQISSTTGNTVIQKGGWSAWTEESCHSGCIAGAKGAQTRRRLCNNPLPQNTLAGCEGLGYDVTLCKDEMLCKKKRKSTTEYGTMRCKKFSERLPELDSQGSGLQAPHEPERPWMACAIFCRRNGDSSYYTPRIELNDIGLDPYFPDGTWCHTEQGENYYCRQHHCLPASFRFAKGLIKNNMEEDLNLGPQNARPGNQIVPEQMMKYLSLGSDGLPLLTTLSPSTAMPLDEGGWTVKDYIELPQPVKEEILEAQVSEPCAPKLLDLDTMFSAAN
ncbi:A disintegrin and metalloproteinase with thrombospondin motifs adt-2 [Neodiprion pinetum]|uniref:A disintegrin and metalloproteinase with thrombospondin motifs adt-2-like n=1 Tax=Neodiprion lecontei TaxID=441921 RepID=A0A6J0BS01_NEOLC|nr:A disintegrin and metalloproteinase with thrombospondin motifs adt-2-like [Neodiprion lecontei]XP_046473542.1 A disintegrin and metalloproteinase with thrombospondin motifs adt-2-like [Neodiprion pinetum]